MGFSSLIENEKLLTFASLEDYSSGKVKTIWIIEDTSTFYFQVRFVNQAT